MVSIEDYRKGPKFLEARKFSCNLPKIQTKRPNLKVFCQMNANGIANSEDPDQSRSSLIWVCSVCPDLSVRKFRIITLRFLTSPYQKIVLLILTV